MQQMIEFKYTMFFFASAFLLMWPKTFSVLAKVLALQGHSISNSFCMKLKKNLVPMDIHRTNLILHNRSP